MNHAWIACGPVFLLLLGCVQISLFGKARRLSAVMAEIVTLVAALLALMSALAVFWAGAPAILSVRLGAVSLGVQNDAITASLAFLVTFVGWVVVRYSRTYLEGEAGRSRFLGWVMATLACVLAFLQSVSLVQMLGAWVCTSLVLHRLLLFYPERARARRAARKKFVLARIADVALFGAFVLLSVTYQSADIGAIRSAIGSGDVSLATHAAAFLIIIAACIKSAQLPVHGWLTEIMEVPTPVSALLHAGVINAGGVLIIRLADVVSVSPGALTLLVLVGSVSAVVASAVMLTQPAVKNSLAWSTISQMGFMMIQCGLGLYALAFFHIIMHSLYKAHAFLTAGNSVKDVRRMVPRGDGPLKVPALLVSLAAAAALYVILSENLAAGQEPLQGKLLGGTLALASGYLMFRILERTSAPWRVLSGLGAAAATTLVYVLLQRLAFHVTGGLLPYPAAPDSMTWAVAALTMAGFASLIVLQAALPGLHSHPAFMRLKVHLQNGLYIHPSMDRILSPFLISKGSQNV